MHKNITVAVALVLLLAAGISRAQDGTYTPPPPMDPKRKVNEQDCAKQVDVEGRGNLKCRDISERERRRMAAEQERQAKARKEAAERAERERLARERAEQLAREEAARKAREAEEARLAAEKRRLEEEAARKAEEERLRQEKLAEEARLRKEKAEAEERARLAAEQAAREAAEAECRRLAQELADGRALLVSFVDGYGTIDENKKIAGQITTFLNTPRKAKPCPAPVATIEQPAKKQPAKKKAPKATVATTAPASKP